MYKYIGYAQCNLRIPGDMLIAYMHTICRSIQYRVVGKFGDNNVWQKWMNENFGKIVAIP